MNDEPAQPRRLRSRRLGEIRTAHGFLRFLFPASRFADAEFEKALRFAGAETEAGLRPPAEVIRRLTGWYRDGNPGVACRVLDAGSFGGGLLWMQASVERTVADLQRGRPAVLFVTGLREAVRPPGRRWSRAAERECRDNRELLEERVHRWSRSTGTPVSLVVS